MPRVFVNGFANFMIKGGMVSFSLQDQQMRDPSEPSKTESETIADVIMTERDFAHLLTVMEQYKDAFEKQFGRGLGENEGGQKRAGGGQTGGGMKIRPRP